MTPWIVGDKWKTQHDHIFVVVQVLEDESAMLQMIHPVRSRPMKQKPVPYNWTNLTRLPQAEPIKAGDLKLIEDLKRAAQ